MAHPLAKVLHLLKPKRRWAQFTLRGFFVLVTILCAALSTWVVPAERQRRAAAAIEALGGMVMYAPDLAASATGTRAPTQSFLRRWLPRDYIDQIHLVHLHSSNVTDADLACLRALPDLRLLRLDFGRITDAGLLHLSTLVHLETLELNRTQITGAGLSHLEGLANLRCLGLNRTEVTDAGLLKLRGLTRLEMLRLNGTKITDSGLAHLLGLTRLRWLFLNNRITDAGLVQLRELKSLEVLRLAESQVTDAGLVELRQALPNCQIIGPNIHRVSPALFMNPTANQPGSR